jgi:AcrR family transcriptional regulator
VGTEGEHEPAGVIIGVVIELLESGGSEAIQLREVARRARVSLATIYRLFKTRDDLIVTALQRWMAANSYVGLAPPAADESLHDGLMRVFRHVFEPWERNPRMLEAFHRACTGPGGERLDLQGMNAVEPIARAVLEGADPGYVADIDIVLTNIAYALIGRFADGTLEVTAILPMLDRVVYRLTANNEPAAAAVLARRAQRPITQDPGADQGSGREK